MRGKKDKKTKQERARRFAKWFWAIFSIPVAALLVMVALTAFGVFGPMPSFEELENPKNNLATELISEDGKHLGSYFIENRTYVDFNDLSPALPAALIATEDMRYYNHSGVDFIALTRVAVKTMALGRREQGGGSTITQQLAKNLFPRPDYSGMNKVQKMGRMAVIKFKEWITAIKLEYNYTKEEIITMYLNTVFYGSNAYGIKAAAQTFFGKEPSELNVQESALLIGVVNAPSRYNPVRNPERATQRRNTVMSRMQKSGYLTKDEYRTLAEAPIELDFNPISHDEGMATYFREMIRVVMNMPKPQRNQYPNNRIGRWDYQEELKRWESNPLYGWCHKNTKADGSSYNIYRDGLKIYTTVNAKMQQYAEESIQQMMESDIQPRLDRQRRSTGVLFNGVTGDESERIILRAMRQTDRYRNLREDGATDEQIDREFRTPAKMKVFTYRGEVDTLMSPRDSILHHKAIMRASFMAVDPSNGHVKAYVGGPNFKYFKYDMVRQGKRQIGSTIKPFVYTFAIDYMGFTPCTMVPNLPTTIETYTGEPWTPKEAGNVVYDGVLHPLRWGLSHSRNNYSAWIMKEAKQPKAVADFINQMGIHSFIDPVNALCLGTADVSLFEMVGAYATFANKGVFIEPVFVTRIEDRQGNLIASFTPQSSDAVNEHTAYAMLEMLKAVAGPGGTGARMSWQFGFRNMDIGGKTGTSQENRDAWFMGVAPKIVAGTWVGGEDQSVHITSSGEGSALALPIFGQFMQKVYADKSLGIARSDAFPRPLDAVRYDCPDSLEPEKPAVNKNRGGDEFFD